MRTGRKIALVIHHNLLELLEGAKSDGGLGDGAIDEDREASVQASNPVCLHCLLTAVPYPLVLAHLPVELQLSLDVLGGVGDADLDAPCDPAGNNPFQGLVRTSTGSPSRGSEIP